MDPHNHNHFEFEEEDRGDIPGPTLPADENDLYGCLNVSRTATTEEITAAYRRLSRMYHPDKHQDKENKHKAETLFNKIKQAHEILSDPAKRAIYDTVGLEALEMYSHQVVLKHQTPQEIRDTYEQLSREKEELEVLRRTNPKGIITVSVNAIEVFRPPSVDQKDASVDQKDASVDQKNPNCCPVEAPPVKLIEFTGFNFNQSIEAPLTLRDTLVFSGAVKTDNGKGSGNLNLKLRKLFSNRAQGEFWLGGSTEGLDFGLRGFIPFCRTYSVSGSMNCLVGTGRFGYAAGFGLGKQIDENTWGHMTWQCGHGTLTTELVRETSTNRFGLTVELGIPDSFAQLSASHNIDDDVQIRGNVKGGTFGGQIEYGIKKRITRLSTVGATMIVGIPHGVLLKLEFVRAGQTTVIPIQLAEGLVPAAIFYGTMAPLVLFYTFNKLVIEPYQKEKERKKKEAVRKAYRTKIQEKKREAQGALTLMEVTYTRLKAEEEQRDGLVITSATYGRLVVGPDELNLLEDEIIDVMIPLQCLVQDSALVLHQGTKSSLPGFYDPAPGENKSLLIKYTFKNEAHEILVQDEDELKIPRRAHILQNPK